MGDFKLSASLSGHDDDVRSVAFANSDLFFSASRDATVRLWRRESSVPPSFDCTISSHGDSFVNVVCFLQPTQDYPEGLVISGSKSSIIEVRQTNKSPEENADALLLGHGHNVCSLDVDARGGWIVSGSWDNTARLWKIGKWESSVVLEGHHGSVWAVLAYDEDTVITGCADQLIRVFNSAGKHLRTIQGSKDVVRALCRLPVNHNSSAQFASAGNDGIIRLWTLSGQLLAQLKGHESFIYALSTLPTGEIVSSGEDRTVRVWKDDQCVQTITHPAISVWSVAACSENGDIVTGASDRVVRVFTRDPGRYASEETIRQFEEAVKSSSIPQQALPNINKEKLPDSSFLQQKSGTKEGQVVMIREDNGNVTAHQWSVAQQKWINVGTVVDAAGSSGRKQEYLGQDYDYVFDVDIEEGKPPLKLPYNLSQNPYEAATKFLQDNELPMGYLDQVAKFITTNTQGASIGQSSQDVSQGADPWGQERRYRPGDAPAPTPSQPTLPISRPRVLPQTSYLSIKSANLKTIQKKIEELNRQFIQGGSKDIALNPPELKLLDDLVNVLGQHANGSPKPASLNSDTIVLVLKIATAWPPHHRIPGLDLLRLVAAYSPSLCEYKNSEDADFAQIIGERGILQNDNKGNNAMLAVRAFANIFETSSGLQFADAEYGKLHELTKKASTISGNRNLTIAIATLYINYAVLLTSDSHVTKPSSSERGIELLDELVQIISKVSDSEALYRSLVAAGTLLRLGEEVRIAAKDIFGMESAMRNAEKGIREPRIKNIIAEIRDIL